MYGGVSTVIKGATQLGQHTTDEDVAQLELVLENVGSALLIFDQDTRCIYVNSEAGKIAQQVKGLTREQLVGMTIDKAFPEIIGTHLYDEIKRVMAERTAVVFEEYLEAYGIWSEYRLYASTDRLVMFTTDITARKRADESAQSALAQLEAERQQIINIFESISDAFHGLDEEFRITYLNPQATDLMFKLSGKTNDQLIGQVIWDAFPGTYDSPFGHAFRYAMHDRVSTQVEAYFPPMNAWFQGRIYPAKNGLSVYFTDITEQKRDRLALLDAEERLRMMIDSVKDHAIFAMDTEGQVTTWNSGAERVFGYEEVEILGQSSSIVYTPEDHVGGIPGQEMTKAAELGFAESERWHVRKNGSRFFASDVIRPIHDEGGVLKGFTKVARDMTERKLAEQRAVILQQLAAQLSTQIAAQDVATSVIGAIHRTVAGSLSSVFLLSHENQTLESLWTEELSDVDQKPFRQLPLQSKFPSTDAVRSHQIVEITSREEYIQRYPHLVESITAIGLQATICIPLVVESKILGVVAVSFRQTGHPFSLDRDLLIAIAHLCAQALQRSQLFETERQARQAAEQANAIKIQFLGMISHELRTPLASIKGFISTLLADDVIFPPETQHRFLGIVDNEADKLTNLVEQLLDLSRMQAGTLAIEPTLQPFTLVLESAMAQMQTLSAQHQLLIQVPEHMPPVLVDPQRIAQVLVNLVGNAAKFSPASTPITIEVSEINQFLQVNVSDLGVGIPVEDRENVFEAFRQVQRKDASQRLGAGLGLAICKSIIAAHGGRVWIHDQERGTTISFTLPVAAEV